jgi:diguanylate cyclase (GGDEF)-like protein/PAS domain S-box-containing protein
VAQTRSRAACLRDHPMTLGGQRSSLAKQLGENLARVTDPGSASETGHPGLRVVDAAPPARNTRLQQIVETQREIASAELDVHSIMKLICERTQWLTAADAGTILVRDGNDLVHRAGSGFIAENVGARLGIDDTFSGSVYRQNRGAICNDTGALANPLARQRGIGSLIAVPLRHGDETIGLVSVLSHRKGAFSQEDLETLELLSVVLSAALSHAAELEARRSQVDALKRFRTVFDGATIGIVSCNAEGRAVEANPALERMLGYSASELATIRFSEITHPDDVGYSMALFDEIAHGRRETCQLEKRYIAKDGAIVWVHVSAMLQRDERGAPVAVISMIEDITERKIAEEELRRQSELNEHMALHDALTGLPNRILLRDRIRQAVAKSRREGGRVAVLMMDLDRFKEVNDSLGHDAGDTLLQELGTRLRAALRESDTVARLGGDEFGLVLHGHEKPADVLPVLEKIRTALETPVVVQELPLAIEASVGVAFYPDDGDDVDTLLRHADVAMYTAKEQNLAYALYDPSSDRYDPARLTIVGELRRALEERELVLHYQPKALLANGDVSSVEALIRWNHPTRGFVLPDQFIPIAQQTGLIKPLTLYVVDEALRQSRAWQAEGLTLSIAVNLSMRNLLDLEFPDEIGRLLRLWDVDPALLEFEITESTMLADPIRTKHILDRLSAMGIRLAIDDFGTGYSSLAYLKRLPVDEIKIDRSFVMHMSEDEDNATIVRSTIDLGRNLGLEVVAEGVETAEVWETLTMLGCTVAQGYYLSRPVPANELRDWLRTRDAERAAG